MPLLNSYDPYDPCIHSSKFNNPTYCIVKTKIKPNPSNQIWNEVETFSNETMLHFRHDLLTRGVCIENCFEELSHVDEKYKNELYIEDFNTEDVRIYKNFLLNFHQNF